jgi:hypothetical protein
VFDEGQRDPTTRRFVELAGAERELVNSPPDRPLGITVIAVLNFLAAAVLIAVFASALIGQPEIPNPDPFGIFRLAYDTQRQMTLCLAPVQIALSLALGIGLWRMKSWAYPLAVGAYGLLALSSIVGRWGVPLTMSSLVSSLIPVGTVAYLLQGHIRDLFRERPPV